MKCLVLYYSRTGHARHLANDLGESLGADVEEIRCDRYHARFVGAFRALHDAVRGRSPAIAPLRRNPADYDILIVAGPVWASRPAAPVRAALEACVSNARRIAFALTLIGSGGETAVRRMARIARMHPVAALIVTQAELASGRHRRTLSTFCTTLQKTVS
ncbi:MAG: flavodoxin [Hyphomicrobiales bacterium]|nr:MAG: flavodoxin [Hyphomicrobiales bacterium]